MNINDDKKVDILLSLLNERYDASHKMRERSLNFAIWILGFGIGITWILLDNVNLLVSQKIILTMFISIIGVLTKNFLSCIEKGFNSNKDVMITLEDALGCYEQERYIAGKSLYPDKYKNFDCNKTSHFNSLYIWLWVVGGLLISLIWIKDIMWLLIKK